MKDIQAKYGEIGNRAFFFGESLFTTLRIYNGTLLFYDEHLARLEKGAGFLWPDIDNVKFCIESALKNGKGLEQVSNGRLRITLSLEQDRPQMIPSGRLCVRIDGWAIGPLQETLQAISLRKSEIVRFPNQRPSFLKTGNYLDAILERKKENNFDDIFYCTFDDHVTEATTSNIFCSIGGKIVTPPTSSLVLDGVIRRFLIDLLGRESYAVEERELKYCELLKADCVWLTNSISLLRPIKKIDSVFFERHSLIEKVWKLITSEIATFE